MSIPVLAKNITKRTRASGESTTENLGRAAHAEQIILDAVSLTVAPGEFVGLVGPSGCGKTSLLSVVGLADDAWEGELVLDGVTVRSVLGQRASERDLTELRRHKVGYLFQYFNLLSTLTVVENVMLPLLLQGRGSEEAEARAQELLARVAVAHRSRVRPATLSGGEMQRVAFARAVAHRPAVVLADEPTGNLDSHSGAVVLDLLAELVNDGISVLMATHSEAAVQRTSRVIRMRDGRIVTEG